MPTKVPCNIFYLKLSPTTESYPEKRVELVEKQVGGFAGGTTTGTLLRIRTQDLK
jgi:hypothetical protein